jgi:hypothetical protein
VAICSTGFMYQARVIAGALGISHVPVAEYPGTIPTDSRETVREKAAGHVVPIVIDGLRGLVKGEDGAAPDPEPAPRDVVFSGGLDEVQDHFEDRLWTDGLPVIPPTLGRVQRFMDHTARDAGDVIGTLLPARREATVWSVAVNGVMAGCRPEYMPILVAVVEAIADPEFRIQDAGSTPGWEPMVTVSGPMVKRLGFNTKSGLMRVGPRANTSIGRFLRLYMRNVAGLLTPPGRSDKGSIGASFNVAMGEDDDALEQIGWPSTRVEQGFEPGDDVVTVRSVYAISQPIYSGGSTAEPHLAALAHIHATTVGPWIFTGIWFQRWAPLLLLNPAVAAVIAGDGLSKDDVRQYIYEHAKIGARWLDVWPHHVGGDEFELTKMIERGEAPPDFSLSDDPDRLVPTMMSPDELTIVVAGDPGRNQSRFYINNHEQGPPVSRRVAFT